MIRQIHFTTIFSTEIEPRSNSGQIVGERRELSGCILGGFTADVERTLRAIEHAAVRSHLSDFQYGVIFIIFFFLCVFSHATAELENPFNNRN